MGKSYETDRYCKGQYMEALRKYDHYSALLQSAQKQNLSADTATYSKLKDRAFVDMLYYKR